MVRIIDGIFNFATRMPLKKPHKLPDTTAIKIDNGIPKPALYTVPKITAVRAIIDAIDKSISPEIIIKVKIIAIKPYST